MSRCRDSVRYCGRARDSGPRKGTLLLRDIGSSPSATFIHFRSRKIRERLILIKGTVGGDDSVHHVRIRVRCPQGLIENLATGDVGGLPNDVFVIEPANRGTFEKRTHTSIGGGKTSKAAPAVVVTGRPAKSSSTNGYRSGTAMLHP